MFSNTSYKVHREKSSTGDTMLHNYMQRRLSHLKQDFNFFNSSITMLQAIIFQGKNISVGFAWKLCRDMCSQCSCGSFVYAYMSSSTLCVCSTGVNLIPMRGSPSQWGELVTLQCVLVQGIILKS